MTIFALSHHDRVSKWEIFLKKHVELEKKDKKAHQTEAGNVYLHSNLSKNV